VFALPAIGLFAASVLVLAWRLSAAVQADPDDRDSRTRRGDKILGVGQGAAGQIEDVVGMKISKVVALLTGKRDTAVRLEVVAADGRQGKTLTITRRRIEMKHRQATGSVHQTGRKPDGQPYKIGVIDVPDFYMDMNGAIRKQTDFKCASRDVRKILEDFGKKEVDAVVLDVRHGGGSLTEPIKITGLFRRV
jgi:carboxyl-terminal processing protease